jgi:hypothetical protein
VTLEEYAECAFVAASDQYVCTECGFLWRKPIRRRCGTRRVVPRPETLEDTLRRTRRLTFKGKILICLPPPGDAVATLTKYTGVAHLAELWERISGNPCGCADRQAWMNQAWKTFVWQHFSEASG